MKSIWSPNSCHWVKNEKIPKFFFKLTQFWGIFHLIGSERCIRSSRSQHSTYQAQKSGSLIQFLTGLTPISQIKKCICFPRIHVINCGVPQGSILGPILYLYAPTLDVINRHGFCFHSYVDDTRLYITVPHDDRVGKCF